MNQEITESDGGILFKTENNKLKKLMSQQDDLTQSEPEEHNKLKVLTQLIEDLEKPRINLPFGKHMNTFTNRGGNFHYAHTSNNER